jgi:hypothetical protein
VGLSGRPGRSPPTPPRRRSARARVRGRPATRRQ